VESTVTEEWLNLSGTTGSDATSLTVNGKLVDIGGSGGFQSLIRLSPGSNTLVVESKDRAGNSVQQIFTVTYATESGTNWAAIGVMIVLLVVGLILGLFFGGMLGLGQKEEVPEGEIPPEEELMDEEIPEDMEEMPMDDEFPEDAEEALDEDAELPEGAEPIPAEEGMPEDLPEEEIEELPEGEEMEAESEELEPESEEIQAEEEISEEPETEETEAPDEDEDPRIAKLREAYESGKISQELYEKNLARFREQ